jgi:PadR family transcriptional regulator AphA
MARRTSSTPEALLGLLAFEPMSGYALGQAIHASIGHFWNESYGQIYPSLKRLEAAGCVVRKKAKQKSKPDRQIYAITPAGRKRLQAWLAIAPQPEIPRNELLLKLFFGTEASIKLLIGYVEHMAAEERALLSEFSRIEREGIAPSAQHPGAPYWKMAARFGQLELKAHVHWAEETLSELRALNAKQTSERKEKRHANP